jgi:hypothetical protein
MKEKFDYVLKLQVVDCTLSDYAKPGQQYIHEDLYFNGLYDAFDSFLRLNLHEFNKNIVEKENYDRHIESARIQGVGGDIAVEIRSHPEGLYLLFPKTIGHFQHQAGIVLSEDPSFDVNANYFRLASYGQNKDQLIVPKYISELVINADVGYFGASHEEYNWNYALHLRSNHNTTYMTDQARLNGWRFHEVWHYKDIHGAFKHLLQTELMHLHGYVSFYNQLPKHIFEAKIADRFNVPVLSIDTMENRQLDKGHDKAQLKGLYLQCKRQPHVLEKELNIPLISLLNMEPGTNVALIASYDRATPVLSPTAGFEQLTALLKKENNGISRQSSYRLELHRESFAGPDHLGPLEVLKRTYTNIEEAIHDLCNINPVLFNKEEAYRQQSLVWMKQANILDVANGRSIIVREESLVKDVKGDLVKLHMDSISIEALKAVRLYITIMEQHGSPHFCYGKVNSAVQRKELSRKNMHAARHLLPEGNQVHKKLT